MEKEETVSYSIFVNEIVKDLEEEFAGDYQIMVNHVVKNNNTHLDGLTILKKGEKAAPNIYLNYFYEHYKDGKTIHEIVQEIKEIYNQSCLEQDDNLHLCFKDFNSLKANIIFRLVNFERNKEMLQEIPHIMFFDLAVTYHYLVQSTNEGIQTIRITNELMKIWDTNLQEIMDLSKKNTPELFPATIQSMDEFIKNMEVSIEQDIGSNNEWEKGEEKNKLSSMYILTNHQNINGASCLLYDTIEKFANKMDTDFYILPSSIHELILVPMQNQIMKTELERMVKDVNEMEVPKEDILSYHVYTYCRKESKLTM